MTDDTLIFESHLSNDLQVMIVYPSTERYKVFEQQFKVSGHAFLLHELNTIVIDGAVVEEPWFTTEHLMVIQAHELGHYLAKHAVEPQGKQYLEIENEADWIGCMLLKKKGYDDAYSLHEQEYNLRYSSTPAKDSKKFKEKLGQLIN